MLENIINIGNALKDNGEEKTVAELWIKDNQPMDMVLVIDLTNDVLDFYVKEFEDSTYIESLFYQQGNDLKKGSGIAVHTPKNLFKDSSKGESQELKSLEKKLRHSLNFLEIDTEKYFDKYKEIIMNEISQDVGNKYFIMFTKNDKTPFELYRDKFEEQIKVLWKTNEKLSKSVSSTICQNCSKEGKNYDTAIFKCYNNDKKTYSNIYNDIGQDVFAYSLCENCIKSLLNGKQYILDNMTTRWLGSDVMFIPHELTASARQVYEVGLSSSKDLGDNSYTADVLLKSLYNQESSVFEEISKIDTMTDILFYKSKNSEWKITYSIQGVMPSRFGQLGKVLSKYEQVLNHNDKIEFLYLKDVLEYSLITPKNDHRNNNNAPKNTPKSITPKDRMKLIDALLKGKKYNKNLFYRSALKEYKRVYINSIKDNSKYLRPITIRKINKIYNIFAELGCFDEALKIVHEINGDDGGRYKMIEYKNREELFEQNSNFFDSDIKKAWFILGELYSKTIYESKAYYKTSEEDKKTRVSHLENGFIFSQKFDYSTFIKLSNKCKEQLIKYKKPNTCSFLFNEMKDLMSKDSKHISQEEAKYIFFWGMEAFFTDYAKKSDDKNNENNENMEDVTNE